MIPIRTLQQIQNYIQDIIQMGYLTQFFVYVLCMAFLTISKYKIIITY